jgi:polyferredoxin
MKEPISTDASAQVPIAAPAQNWMHSVKLVVWAFLGIRSNSGYQQDLARVNPLHVVLVGVVAALLLVISLMVLVNWVVAK